MRPGPDDELTVPLTLQAAALAHVTPRTLHRWISSGRLRAYTDPEKGRTVVLEGDLLDVEAERRRSRNQGRPRPSVNAA